MMELISYSYLNLTILFDVTIFQGKKIQAWYFPSSEQVYSKWVGLLLQTCIFKMFTPNYILNKYLALLLFLGNYYRKRGYICQMSISCSPVIFFKNVLFFSQNWLYAYNFQYRFKFIYEMIFEVLNHTSSLVINILVLFNFRFL